MNIPWTVLKAINRLAKDAYDPWWLSDALEYYVHTEDACYVFRISTVKYWFQLDRVIY